MNESQKMAHRQISEKGYYPHGKIVGADKNKRVFSSVCRELGITVFTCRGDGDAACVVKANQYQSLLVGNDSDFYIFELKGRAKYCNLDHFWESMKSKGHYKVPVFDQQKFTKKEKISVQDVQLLAVLLGNDFYQGRMEPDGKSAYKRTEAALNQIRSNKSTIIPKLSSKNKKHAKTVSEIKSKVIDFYNCHSTFAQCLTAEEASDMSAEALKKFSSEMKTAYPMSEYLLKRYFSGDTGVATSLITGKWYCPSAVDDKAYDSCFDSSESLFDLMMWLKFSHVNKEFQVEYFCREKGKSVYSSIILEGSDHDIELPVWRNSTYRIGWGKYKSVTLDMLVKMNIESSLRQLFDFDDDFLIQSDYIVLQLSLALFLFEGDGRIGDRVIVIDATILMHAITKFAPDKLPNLERSNKSDPVSPFGMQGPGQMLLRAFASCQSFQGLTVKIIDMLKPEKNLGVGYIREKEGKFMQFLLQQRFVFLPKSVNHFVETISKRLQLPPMVSQMVSNFYQSNLSQINKLYSKWENSLTKDPRL